MKFYESISFGILQCEKACMIFEYIKTDEKCKMELYYEQL